MNCLYDCLGLLMHFLRTFRGYVHVSALVYSLASLNNFSIARDLTEEITVHEKDGVYYINASSQISASAHHVRNVLTDYIHIYRLNDSIIESSILTPDDSDKVQVETLVQCCIPMFCKDVTRVEEVDEIGPDQIQTRIVADKSDFRSGEATWKIEPDGDATHLTYKASLEPDFFIPPVIGTRIVVSNMRSEFRTTFQRIEHIAAINEAREWDTDFQFSNAGYKKKVKPCTNVSSADC